MVSLYGNETGSSTSTVHAVSGTAQYQRSPHPRERPEFHGRWGAVPTITRPFPNSPVTRRLFARRAPGNGGLRRTSFCVAEALEELLRVCSDVRPKNGGGGFSDGLSCFIGHVDGKQGF